MWKAKGDSGMERHVDRAMDNAQYLLEILKKREHFRLVTPQVSDKIRSWILLFSPFSLNRI